MNVSLLSIIDVVGFIIFSINFVLLGNYSEAALLEDKANYFSNIGDETRAQM